MAVHIQPRDCGPIDLAALAAVPGLPAAHVPAICTHCGGDYTIMCEDTSTRF
ncbi:MULTISPECIES: hypothetical protein [Actinomadura]|uniref:Uncharacterized protein n=1 Tax=Actinomadura yumaensis TaxID=111807 RepID=A0ABW2D0T5_9ACTN|nr:hypothetical protein [Actinomadura sp. J1-007]